MNAAEDRRYEEAAVLRDRISLLRDVMPSSGVETTGGTTDAGHHCGACPKTELFA